MNDVDPMPLERFEALAAAYGAAVGRWPEAVRAEGLRRAREPAFAAVLARAGDLDARLDAWTVPAPSAELSGRIVAAAPVSRPRFARRARLWWSGIGLAASLAGAAAGAAGAAVVTPTETPSSDANTAFGDIAGQEV